MPGDFVASGTGAAIEIAITVDLAGAVDGGVITRLANAGARVVNVGPRSVEAYVAPGSLMAVASVPEVVSVRAIARRQPAFTSLGASLHGAAAWNAAGYTGTGVKVGIIDGGFSGLVARVGTELPATVHARCYPAVGSATDELAACENGETHGTAVAETIADIAPNVELYVANPISALDSADTVSWMTTNGVRIINASWASGYLFDGPGDGTSRYPDSTYTLVDQAVAGGALWVNAAGNAGASGWTGAWLDADDDGFLEWSGDDERNSITLAAGESIAVAIRWADPWGASANDYDLQLNHGHAVVASSQDPQAGAGDPYELLEFTAPVAGIYDVTVQRVAGAPTRRLQMLAYAGPFVHLRYQVAAGTLPSPADSANPGMVSVGAVNVASPGTLEPYSSRGPTLDGRIRPDLVAVDCAPTTIEVVFCGTSQAAPFVSGAAALMLQVAPTLTPAQLAARLRSGAVALDGAVPNPASGWGRLALGAAPPGPATSLGFVGQPTGAAAGAPLTGQPTVRLLDAAGTTATSGPSSMSSVTIALDPATGAKLTCDGGLSRKAVAGIASFSGCAVDQIGSGYRIQASAAGLAAIVSAPFEVWSEDVAAPLTITTSAASITWGDEVAVTGRLEPVPTGAAPSMEFQRSTDGINWAAIGATSAGTDGQARLVNSPSTTYWYRAFVGSTVDRVAATSYPVRVVVRQKLLVRESISSPRTLAAGRTVTFTSTVRPLAGPGGSRVTFVVYRKIGTTWVLFKRLTVATDASGRAAFAWRFSRAGSWYVRAQADATSTNAASAWSAVSRYFIR